MESASYLSEFTDGAARRRHKESKEEASRIRSALENSGIASNEMLSELFSEDESAAVVKQKAKEVGLIASDDDLLEIMAAEMGFDVVRMRDCNIDKEMIEKSGIDPATAKKYGVMPVDVDEENNIVTVALADPMNIAIPQTLEFLLAPRQVRCVVAQEEEVLRSISTWFEAQQLEKEYKVFEDKRVEEQEEIRLAKMQETESINIDQAGQGDNPIVKFVDLIFKQAISDRASDIHIEPTKNGIKIRFRTDGVLTDLPSPPKKWQNMIISRLKVLSGMDLAEKRIPQDGRIKLMLAGKKLDLRVNSMPSLYGETVVMRILDQANVMMGLEDVGFLPETLKTFNQLIKSPNGIIMMTGPTGSGKTTTLYSALSTLNNVETKIITIEHPVEYMLDGINQVQVSHEVGLDFAVGLRTMLRQSPDVIMVGEIRDLETAEIAIRAALTGHLVFSTLHTNDAPSAMSRLTDMGVKPFLVASAVQAVVAQRLARRVCSVCKETYYPTENELIDFGLDPKEYVDTPLFKGVGCDRCSDSGYRGRTAIHEIFVNNPELRQLIMRNESSARLKKLAVDKYNMRSLRIDGWEKILLGQTTMEEIVRLTQED
jgi:type II secretory ATPase GspE/PulE/Tfp pilus assembly ATPase PilB-like protein